MNKFIADFKDTARQDFRVFFAPFVGAVNAVKKELQRPTARNFQKKVDPRTKRG